MSPWRSFFLVVLLTGCATSGSNSRDIGQVTFVDLPEGVTIRIENDPSDEVAAAVLRQELQVWLEQASRWGSIQQDVVIRLHTSTGGLREVVHHDHQQSIDGWATHRAVDIHSPRAAGVERWRDHLRTVVVHELTHVVFFQNAQVGGDWEQAAIPFWFVEGMAVAAARPEVVRRGWSGLRALKNRRKVDNVLNPNREMLGQNPELIYGAAAVAFGELIRLKGEDAVREIVGGLARGERFPEVFRRVYARSLGDVTRTWRSQIGQEF